MNRSILAWAVAVVSALLTGPAIAVPPLVTGDVPTADKSHWEIFVGARYQKTGTTEWQAPFTEVVYGITARQELTLEIPYLLVGDQEGFGDAVVGTKFLFVRETERVPGVAASFEVKLPTASEEKSLGSGEFDYDLRLRSQKTFGWFTPIVNVGYTFIGEPDGQTRRDVLFLAFAQEYKVAAKTKLLSEIFWRNSDEPGGPARFAGNIGFKHRLFDKPHLDLHFAIGKSLRNANRGGPTVSVYSGIKLEF